MIHREPRRKANLEDMDAKDVILAEISLYEGSFLEALKYAFRKGAETFGGSQYSPLQIEEGAKDFILKSELANPFTYLKEQVEDQLA